MVKVRTKRHEDGRIELIRVLSADESWSADDPLAYEASIVWMQEIDELPFVRETMITGAQSRSGKLRASGVGRIVGYAKLSDDAPIDSEGHGFRRRFFFLKEHDLQRDRIPRQAVDPRSVLPGIPGRKLREN